MQQILTMIERKEYKAVHSHCMALIHADVTDPRPYCGLAHIAFDHDNFSKAFELFERARKYAPRNPVYAAQHAKALSLRARNEEARKVADEVKLVDIQDAHSADMLGVIYSRSGFHERAITFFDKAVKLDPTPANFYYNLAASQQFSGLFELAETNYRAALKRNPKLYHARSALAALKKQTETENDLPRLKADFKTLSSDSSAALHLGHAIAKTYEDLGQFETSLTWLNKAKVAKRAELNYTIKSDLDLFEAARGTEAKDADIAPLCEVEPIFIVGLPRTGTTLVDRIISSHSKVTSAGELNLFAELIKKHGRSPSNLVMDAEGFTAIKTKSVSSLGFDYATRTQDLARGAQRFTDKMPLNFLNCGLIHRALPNARIVTLRRGAMDSCLSNYRQLFSTQFSYYNYTFDLEDTAKYYRAFDALMTYWRETLPEDRFMEIGYEDIIGAQETKTRELLAFCGLDYEEACLRFHENQAPVATASSVQVRQPLYSGSIGRWKKYGHQLDGLKTALGTLAS